jgi:hypothetical protein
MEMPVLVSHGSTRCRQIFDYYMGNLEDIKRPAVIPAQFRTAEDVQSEPTPSPTDTDTGTTTTPETEVTEP